MQNGRQFASPRCREVSSATRAHSFQSFVPMVFMFILFFATWRSFSAHHSAPFGFSAFAYLFSFLFFFDGRPTAFFFRRFSPRRVRLFSIFRSPLSFSGLRPLRSSLVWSATTVYKLGFDWISSAYLFFVYIFLWWFNRIVLWGLDRPPRLEPRRLHWMFPVLLSNPSCMRFRFRFLSNSAQFDFFFQVCSHASVGSMIFP